MPDFFLLILTIPAFKGMVFTILSKPEYFWISHVGKQSLKEFRIDNQLKKSVTLPSWLKLHVCAQGLFILLLFP